MCFIYHGHKFLGLKRCLMVLILSTHKLDFQLEVSDYSNLRLKVGYVYKQFLQTKKDMNANNSSIIKMIISSRIISIVFFKCSQGKCTVSQGKKVKPCTPPFISQSFPLPCYLHEKKSIFHFENPHQKSVCQFAVRDCHEI